MRKTKHKRGEIVRRFREMKVGETIFFPFDEFDSPTIRSTPTASLYREMAEGKRWTVKTDIFGKRMAVTRLL